ncbi:VQ motif-containing protein 4-like [Phoenix dactylifera]|uniref:VQ motif-containing protein 4-like n=1 Tax=Phoenix dactylifera TaxID=42345 RepID=A0A8B8ZY61_PHODC|nr:VQ motif-containing protein 4-like [Phoenix dactylifera]
MENHNQNPQEREQLSSHPTSPNSTASSSSTSTSSKGVAAAGGATIAAVQVASPPNLQPPTPKSIPRSIESNPYPTTFIQADTSSFKQVVQMLTGSAETAAKHAAANPPPPKNPIPPAAKATGPKKPVFKLYERRSSLKNLKMISPLIPTFLSSAPASPAGGAFSPRKQPEILSPSMLDLHSALVLSPVTPLIPDPFNRSPQTDSSLSPAMSAEERAIAEKGFYLHPSPRNTPRDAEPPRLLPLFPVTSPRISSASASSA